ncbi:MAG: hypothetical protein WDM87_06140 [Terracidiphilus sp.]
MQARSDAQIWQEELDALIAAPKHHILLFENEVVRVLDTRVGRETQFRYTRIVGRAHSTS